MLAGRKNKGAMAYRELAAALLKHWKSGGKALPTYTPRRCSQANATRVSPRCSSTVVPATLGITASRLGGRGTAMWNSPAPESGVEHVVARRDGDEQPSRHERRRTHRSLPVDG